MQNDTETSTLTDLPHGLKSDLAAIVTKVRLLFQCRLSWLEFLLEQKGNLLELDEPDQEMNWRYQYLQQTIQEIKLADTIIRENDSSRFKQLVMLFNLSDDEVAVLEICTALSLDPAILYQLPAIKNQPGDIALTEYAIARLLGVGRGFYLPHDSAIYSWGLINHNSENNNLQLDSQIKGWLLGNHDVHASLKPLANFVPAERALPEWPLEESSQTISAIVKEKPSQSVVVNIYGKSGQGKKTFAATVCQEIGLPLLVVNANYLTSTEIQDIYLCAQRQAYLDGCALGWINVKHDLPTLMTGCFPVQFIFYPFDKSVNSEQRTISTNAQILNIELPPLSNESREILCKHHLPDHLMAELKLSELNKLNLSATDIVQAGQSKNETIKHIKLKVQQQQQVILSGLAERLTTPFKRDDWIINDNLSVIYNDFIFEGREREELWQAEELNRLFPRGKGLIALLSGPSGTGKTMAAQVAAAELEKDIYRVDLSRVVSKYIGETTENLAKVIKRAEDLDVILLFDEADALFSKRTDVKDSHDRYANMDINYLLQAIENYTGIAFLATNKKSNMDSSFIRRLRYVLEFPVPEYAQRVVLWQRLLDSMIVEEVAYDRDSVCERLASQIKLTGSQIKYSILSALFIARRMGVRVNVQHLLEGIQRELLKEGRSLSEHETRTILNGLDLLSVTNKVAVT